MKKIELLSPAGNMECLHAAIHNGADAVYISGKHFGARAFATNFTNEEIVESIKYCHLYGVKLYVTVNTLIKESEIGSVLDYITFLHKNGVDAVIMQDIGIINLVHNTLPNLEIHASTQCHTTSDESLKFLKSIGCKRAVLARELTLNEIRNLNTDIEREIFIHGALCVAYSGECLFSSAILNRSGNRGECAGMCRLAYEAYDENNKKIKTDGKYILSPKELCTIEHLKDILSLNIHSLKIEGRMKSPIYVGYVTKLYRKYIDAYYKNENLDVSPEEIKILQVLYNREFTSGHLFDEHIMNSKTPNHIGYKIGVVKEVKKRLKILLLDDIKQGDAIRFYKNNLGMYLNFIYDEKGNLINSGKKGQIIFIDNKIGLTDIDNVYITYSKDLETVLKNLKKIPIKFNVKAQIGKSLEIELKDDSNNYLIVKGNIVESSINNPTIEEVIKEKLGKINDTPFYLEDISINLDNNAFIPMSELNNIRRKLIKELIKIRENKKQKIIIKKYEKNIKNTNSNINEIIIINDEDKYNIKNIFYTENEDLYKKYKHNKNIYYILPRVFNNKEYNNEYLVVNDTASLNKYYKNNSIHTGIYMNVYNTYTIDLLKKYNVKVISLSPELKGTDLEVFKAITGISYLEYGRLELMLLKKNIYNNIDKAVIIDRNNELYNYYKKDNYYVLKTKKFIINNEFIKEFIRMKEE